MTNVAPGEVACQTQTGLPPVNQRHGNTGPVPRPPCDGLNQLMVFRESCPVTNVEMRLTEIV